MTRAPQPIAERPVRVLVVDDSPICRSVLRSILESDPGFVVVGEAGDGLEALRLAKSRNPDVITMDVRMPGLDGLRTIERLMDEMPRPVLVVTELPAGGDGQLVFEATRRGALDVARKPSAHDGVACRALREQVRLLASVPVVRHMAAPSVARARVIRERSVRPAVRVVGVAASAGGPLALGVLLGALPATFPACIALTQHLPLGFAASFARYLASRTALTVVVGDRRTPLVRGTVVLAPDGSHLVAHGSDHLEPSSAPPVGGHRPSADVCFRSLAERHGPASIGVVLSGIGRDGADGLLGMRDAGALTIAQDESSSAIFGMPRAAFECGAAERVLPLGAIGDELIERVGGGVR